MVELYADWGAATRSSPSRTAWPRRLGRLEGADARARRPVQLVGDDVFVTNPEILRQGIAEGVGNSIARQAQSDRPSPKRSRRSRWRERRLHHDHLAPIGETEDTTIADLAVGTYAGQIKTGSASRSDRVAKYNQLLRIEEAARKRGRYAGRAAISQLRHESVPGMERES